MMGGGELKTSGAGGGSLMQLMMWSSTADSKNMMSSLIPCAEEEQGRASTNMAMPPLSSPSSSMLELLQQGHPELNKGGTAATSSLASDLLQDGQESSMTGPWSQLLLGGLVGDHERYSAATALLSKGLEEGSGILPYNSNNFYGVVHGGGEEKEIQTSSGTNKSPHQVSHHHQMLLASSSPRSCITTNLGANNMLGFSNSAAPPPAPELRNHQSDNSSESNSNNATGSAPKKARVQTSSSAQSTLKVRKERLGDRITALHQIVSPFGKTDTASVLQETIGYIRFLLSQIEALSYPYMGGPVGAGSGDSMQQHHRQTHADMVPMKLLNHSTAADAAAQLAEQRDELQDAAENNVEASTKKDLRSRGLCLVPVSCTSHLADDNAASDFWAVAAAPPPPPPPPLGGIISWR